MRRQDYINSHLILKAGRTKHRPGLVLFRLAIALLLVGVALPAFTPDVIIADGIPISANHTSTDITQIPQAAIVAAKDNLHIAYGRLSHGTQLTNGMTGLVSFANGGGKGMDLPDNFFAWSYGGGTGYLDLKDGSLDGQLNYYPGWVTATTDFLTANPQTNVIIWSWCGEVPTKYVENKLNNEYLIPMKQLEAQYPNVKFVYMTGHLDHTSEANDANLKAGNQVIRDFYNNTENHTNNALYDFADIESYDPEGVPYEFADDACNYYESASASTPDGNWAEEWRALPSHTLNQDWYYWAPPYSTGENETFAWHTDCLNGNLKAYAAWWLWARLAGWDGTPNRAPEAEDQPVSTDADTPKDITLTATDEDGDGPYLIYSIVQSPTHGRLSAGSSNSSVTYIPDSGYNGGDSFTFKANDGHLDSNTATVSITVGTPTISITITDNAPAGLDFGNLSPGTTKQVEATSPSITITNDGSSSVQIYLKGTDFTGAAGTIDISYAFYYDSNNPGSALPMSTSETQWKILAPSENLTIYHWLTIPDGTAPGSYSSNFTYKGQ